MIESIYIAVPGTPQGKGRARSVLRKNGTIGHHTPEKTRTYEGLICSLGLDAMKGKEPLDGPVKLIMTIVMPIPPSWPQWKAKMASSNLIMPTVKPDADNVLKAVKDGLNGVVWHDDCQVVRVDMAKVYQGITARDPGVYLHIDPEMYTFPAQIKTKPDGY